MTKPQTSLDSKQFLGLLSRETNSAVADEEENSISVRNNIASYFHGISRNFQVVFVILYNWEIEYNFPDQHLLSHCGESSPLNKV